MKNEIEPNMNRREDMPKLLIEKNFSGVDELIKQLPVTPINYQQSNSLAFENIKKRYFEMKYVNSSKAVSECNYSLDTLVKNISFIMKNHDLLIKNSERLKNIINNLNDTRQIMNEINEMQNIKR